MIIGIITKNISNPTMHKLKLSLYTPKNPTTNGNIKDNTISASTYLLFNSIINNIHIETLMTIDSIITLDVSPYLTENILLIYIPKKTAITLIIEITFFIELIFFT